MSGPGVDELVGRVRELMENHDVSFESAVAGVHAELAGNGDLTAFWEEAGEELLEKALRPHFRNSAGRRSSPAPAKNPSWRDRLRRDPDSIWEIELPVGSTGEVKPVGEFTRSDVRAIEEFYTGHINVLRTRREYWTRIRKRLGPEETILVAYEKGRLRESDLGFAVRTQADLGQVLMEGEEP